MTSTNEFITSVRTVIDYLDRVKLLVCKPCGHCIWADEIKAHLTKHANHGCYSSSLAVLTEGVCLHLWPRALRKPQPPATIELEDVVELPAERFDSLPIHHDGLGCSACLHIVKKESSMVKHLAIHKNLKERATMVRGIHFQQFFTSRYLSTRFPILPEEGASTDCSKSPADDKEMVKAAIYKMRELGRQLEEQQHQVIRPVEHDQLSPFVKRARWDRLFAGQERKVLLALVAPPAPETRTRETILFETMLSVGSKCAAATESATEMFLMELKRTELTPEKEPFTVPTKKTIRRYSRVWGRVLVMFLRVPADDKSGLGITLTSEQALALDTLQEQLSFARAMPAREEGAEETGEVGSVATSPAQDHH
jgi:hypothetical protein